MCDVSPPPNLHMLFVDKINQFIISKIAAKYKQGRINAPRVPGILSARGPLDPPPPPQPPNRILVTEFSKIKKDPFVYMR